MSKKDFLTSMPETDEATAYESTSRRDFLRKSGAVALLSAFPAGLLAKAATTDDDRPSGDNNSNSPILRELQRIGSLPDSQTVIEALATIFTSPEMVSLPTYFLNSEASTLSGFQKDILQTYLKMAANLPALRNLIVGHGDCDSLKDIIVSSPSHLTVLAAAAQIKTNPNLSSLIDQSIQQYITGLSSSPPLVSGTGVPAMDTVLAKFYALSQTTPYINVSKAQLAVFQRSDFPTFVKGLDYRNLVSFIPFETKKGLLLPIDTPDASGWGDLWSLILEAIKEKGDGAPWPLFIFLAAMAAVLYAAFSAVFARANTGTPSDLNGVWVGTFTYASDGSSVSAQWIFTQNADNSVYASVNLGPYPNGSTAYEQYTGNRTGNTITLKPVDNDIILTLTISGNSISGTGIYDPNDSAVGALAGQPVYSTNIQRVNLP